MLIDSMLFETQGILGDLGLLTFLGMLQQAIDFRRMTEVISLMIS